jgi:hypothetical protein
LQKNGEEAFTAQARKAGLDPERVRLFIDILKAVPATLRPGRKGSTTGGRI